MVNATIDAHKVVETLVTCSTFRRLNCWDSLNNSSCNTQSIQHLALCVARVNVTALHCERCTAGIEILELKLALATAVNGISPIATEQRHIEVMCTTTDFLIGIECNAHLAMLDFGMRLQIGDCRNNLSNAGLVIGTQKSVTIGYYKVMAFVILHLGEIGCRQHNAILLAQHNVTTRVILYHAWLHILAAHVGACIKMGNEAHNRNILVAVCRQCGIEVALLIEHHLFQAHLHKLLLKITRKHKLSLGCWNNCCIVTRLCVKSHIFQKTLKHLLLNLAHNIIVFMFILI